MRDFDANQELARLQQLKKLSRKKTFPRSKLDPYTHELSELRKAGATLADLQRWLRLKRVRVEHSTISRFLNKRGHVFDE